MIKHIVMWKLKDEYVGKAKTELAKEIKTRLENLKNIIDEIETIEVGINFMVSDQVYDLVLYSVFKDKEDLYKYQNHPEHVKVVELIKKVNDKRVVVDYEV